MWGVECGADYYCLLRKIQKRSLYVSQSLICQYMGGALLAFVCAGAYFVAPVDSASAAVPIAQYVSTQETYDGVPNNYVINLVEGSNAASVKEAARIAGEQGGVVLTQYLQFASLTVQAAQAGYSQKLAQALASAGIRVHSIAPTHEIAVEDSEIVVPCGKRALCSFGRCPEFPRYSMEQHVRSGESS